MMTKKAFLSMQTILILLTGLLVLCGDTTDNAGKKGKDLTTITGVVVQKGMDESGNVNEVSIDVEADGLYMYYAVVMDQKGRELTRQVDTKVKVSGYVIEDIVKNKSIEVTRWEEVTE
jgi:hypothetical protein